MGVCQTQNGPVRKEGVFGERIVALQVIGSGLILTGVWLIASANVEAEDDGGWDAKRDALRTGAGKGK